MRLTVHRLPADSAQLQALLDAGANAVELDVQLYAGQLRVSHAVPVARRTPYLRVEGKRFALSRRPPGRALADVLAELPSGLPVTFDLKNERGRAAIDLATRLVTEVTPPAGSYVASPNLGSLAIAYDAGWPTMLSVGSRGALRRLLAHPPAYGLDALAVRHTLLIRQVLARLAAAGHPPVIAWVVDDPGRARELAGWGVAGITSDRPEVLGAGRLT